MGKYADAGIFPLAVRPCRGGDVGGRHPAGWRGANILKRDSPSHKIDLKTI